MDFLISLNYNKDMSPVSAHDPLKDKPNLNEVLLIWKSPSHPFKKRNRVFYQTVFAITFLLVVIVFFLNEFMLIGVILSLAFVVYVVSSVPPVEVEHKITPLGFENAGKLFRWQELAAFWFEEKWNSKIIVVQTRLSFPSQFRAVISSDIEHKLKEIIGRYLQYYETPPKTWIDITSDWISEKIPLDNP